jgi:hypothetical protein
MSALARKVLSENADNYAGDLSNTYLTAPECFTLETPVDLLAQAIEQALALLADSTQPTKQRIRILWATAKKARDLGASDVVADAFMQLAIEVNLIDQRGRWAAADVYESTRPHGKEDIEHLITWALRGWNPFEKRPLK